MRIPRFALSAAAAVFVSASCLSVGHAAANRSATRAEVKTAAAQSSMTPAQALQRLVDGNARFASGKPQAADVRAEVRATAAGQYPFAAIVACMDSRTSPERMFDLGIGDAFGVRLAGNIVDEDVLGRLEFATEVAGARVIAVVGHDQCGAVKGACDGVTLGNLTAALADIRLAVEAVPAAVEPRTSKNPAFVQATAEQNVRLGVRAIRERSDILRRRIDAGQVLVVGGMYDLASGRVTFQQD
jgi:carbonic anhydrase